MSDTNLSVLQQVYDALAAGDFAAVLDLLPGQIAAHVPGTSQVAGDYLGKEAVAGYVAQLASLSAGTLRFEPHAVMADDRHGVGMLRDLAERDDRVLAMNNVHVWHLVDEVPQEIWIYPGDLYAWDRFWA